jgi:cyanophycinase-like exopeptidase
VGVASLDDNRLVYLIVSTLIRMKCKCRIKHAVIAHPNADISKAKEIIRKADVVFFSGGDAEVGMKTLIEKNLVGFFHELVNQCNLLLGVSAGTIMLSQEWVRWKNPDDDATAELFPCLGLAPVICDTHAEGDEWVELKAAIKLKGEGAVGYGITSGACLKAYPDGRPEAVGGAVAQYKNVNGEIKRLEDLLPA